MLEPAEVYRSIEIRCIQLVAPTPDRAAGRIRYYCVVVGRTLTDDESINSLKRKIDQALADILPPGQGAQPSNLLYRIVGIDSDGNRTTLAKELTEPRALYLRERLVADTKFAKLSVERDSSL